MLIQVPKLVFLLTNTLILMVWISDVTAPDAVQRPVARWPLNKYTVWRDTSGNGYHMTGTRASIGDGPFGQFQSYKADQVSYTQLKQADHRKTIPIPRSYTYTGFILAAEDARFQLFRHILADEVFEDGLLFSSGVITVRIGMKKKVLADLKKLGVEYWKSWTWISQSYDYNTGEVVLYVNEQRHVTKMAAKLDRTCANTMVTMGRKPGIYKISCVAIFDSVLEWTTIQEYRGYCYGTEFQILPGQNIANSSINKTLYHVTSQLHCLFTCNTDLHCQAFNFNKQQSACALTLDRKFVRQPAEDGIETWVYQPRG